MSTVAICAAGLGKRYRLGRRREAYGTLRESLVTAASLPLRAIRQWRRPPPESLASASVWALRDVTLEVAQGEVVGIIGRNGAGKSTLLKILARITEPTEGSADIVGRIGSLLEVGTGFHPELTGRENVFLNGSILGMRRAEISRQFDAIVAFAGVEPFIDTPVKHYSSGMHLRLGFAVAAHLQTEILLVDEVLAVGDAEFQRRCLGKMNEVRHQGRTVVFVSHNLGAVSQLCQRGVLLQHGTVACVDTAQRAVQTYLSSVTESAGHVACFEANLDAPMQVLGIHPVGADGRPAGRFDVADEIRLRVQYVVRRALKGTNLALLLHREGTDVLTSFDTDPAPELLEWRCAGEHEYDVVLPRRLLKAGLYTVSIGCGFVNRQSIELRRDAIAFRIEALSEDTTSRGYSEDRPGLLLGPLEWKAEGA
jgi:lipopolysaccharide transport system ATP-binding protein